MPIHSSRMPAIFIPHGAGPCFFMDWNPADAWTRMADFLKGLSATLPQRPGAIVLVSAHWLAPTFSVTGATGPTLIYDYAGFPPHTYTLDYPAPGQPALAQRIAVLLKRAQLPAQVDPVRGFDHGVFIPLKLVFPDADIPVVQLSLRSDLDPQAHLQAGLALAALRDEGILIVGSGMSFHNMRGYGDPRFGPISDEFDRWLTSAVEAAPEARWRALCGWAQAPSARLSHPAGAEEHLLPLMLVAGAAQGDAGQRVFSDRVLETTLSAFRFG
ncbi:MAG: aromatic ring-opening dioxygenase catalytic subunit (LigB family) [Bradyrhizobium sp.]|jgi:aromatic ring-opening dioxygenase catalytic subunit (LigB family)